MKCRFFSKTSASSCDTETALSPLLCTASLTGPTLTLNYFFGMHVVLLAYWLFINS